MLSSYDSLKKHNQEGKQNIFNFGTTVRRICESVPVSRVILRFLRLTLKLTLPVRGVPWTHLSFLLYQSVEKVLFFFMLVLFSRIISKFFVLTIAEFAEKGGWLLYPLRGGSTCSLQWF